MLMISSVIFLNEFIRIPIIIPSIIQRWSSSSNYVVATMEIPNPRWSSLYPEVHPGLLFPLQLESNPIPPEIRKNVDNLPIIRGSQLWEVSRGSRSIDTRVSQWRTCPMEMDRCCMLMEIFTGESGLWVRRRGEDCRSIRKEGCSTRVSGRMISSMVTVNWWSQVVRIIRANSKTDSKMGRGTTMTMYRKKYLLRSIKMTH